MTKTKPRSVHQGTIPAHRILREVYRHYLEFREYVAHPETPDNNHVIEHTYLSEDEDGIVSKHTIAFSFWDLHRGIKELAPRKREALFFNVILDQKQADVARRMGITTVSVGQYVDAACRQLVTQHILVDENGDPIE